MFGRFCKKKKLFRVKRCRAVDLQDKKTKFLPQTSKSIAKKTAISEFWNSIFFLNLETFKEKIENFQKISKFLGNFSKVKIAFENTGYRLCTWKKLTKNLP